MMEYFIPEDSESSNSEHHKSIRQLAVEPLDTLDDVEFTEEEILAVLEKFDPSKTPGEDSLNSDILEDFQVLSQFLHRDIRVPKEKILP